MSFDIDQMTLSDIQHLARLLHNLTQANSRDTEQPKLTAPNHTMEVGKSYLIRTVTMMYTGRLAAVTETEVVLDDAAWIAFSGRYATALEKGTLEEVEPYPNRVLVSRASLVDVAEWNHPLPREQK